MPPQDDDTTEQPGSGDASGEGGKIKASDVLNRYGQTADSLFKMAELLADAENKLYRLRETNRELRAKVPADGAVLMTPEDAAALEAYRTLGKPEDVQSKLSAAEGTSAKLAGLERTERFRAAAEAHEYRPGALVKLPSLIGKEIEAREVDGKPAYFVEGVALPEFIAAHDPEFLTALQSQPAAAAAPMQPFPRQAAGGKPAPVNVAQQHIERTYKQQGAK